MGKGADGFGQGKTVHGAGPDALEYRTLEKWRQQTLTPPARIDFPGTPTQSGSSQKSGSVHAPSAAGKPTTFWGLLKGLAVAGALLAIVCALGIHASALAVIGAGVAGSAVGAIGAVPLYGAILLLRVLGWALGWILKIAACLVLIAMVAYVLGAFA